MENDMNLSLIERAQADLDRVKSRIVALRVELQTLLVNESRLTTTLEVIKSYSEESGVSVDAPVSSSSFPELDVSSPMYGKSVPEAAVYLIKEAKRPLTGKEIVKKMQDLGVVFTMPDPVMNANLSLNRRKDLVTRLQGGRWSIKTEETESVEAVPDTGCVKRVSDDDHYEKTLAGLAAAKARGVRGGRRPVMVNGKDEKARELLQQGMPPTKVAHAIGISRSAIYRFIDDNNIRRGEPSKESEGGEDI